MINIQIDAQQLKQARHMLQGLGSRAAPMLAKSLNRSLRGVRTDASKETRKVYNVKAGRVRKSFSLQLASRGNLQGRAVSKGERISLLHFGARPRSPEGRRPKIGVSVRVMEGRKKIPGSFVARMPGGGIGVFRRKQGAGRLPIRKLTGPSVPHMLDHDNVQPALEQGAWDRFRNTLEHELDFYLQKKGLR